MIYYEKPGVVIAWNETDTWIETTWRGHLAETEFVESQKAILRAQWQHKAQAMLVDTSSASAINQSMQHRLATETIPQLMAGGLKYTAILIPQRQTARISVDDAGNASQDVGIATHFFADKGAAEQWLRDRLKSE